MKSIYLIAISLFLVLLSMNFVSSDAFFLSPWGFSNYIDGLKLSPTFTIERLMELCTQENCKINIEEKTVTIQSHYDSRVAIIFSQGILSQGIEDESKLKMTTLLPYDLNESCIQQVEGGGYACDPFIPKYIDPDNYNWKESIRTDLTYLKEIGLLDITSQDIDSIVSLNSRDVQICNNVLIDAQRECYVVDCDDLSARACAEPTLISPEPFPILPVKEFSFSRYPSNLIYWILGIVIIVAIVLFLVLRKQINK